MTSVGLRTAATATAVVAAAFLLVSRGLGGSAAIPSHIPDPALDDRVAPGAALQTIVLSGGCFWGIQEVFEHVTGVTGATAGYAGGSASTATYEQVSTGTTGHAESVRITYDPSQITNGDLLKVFFAVAHDPTERDRQGPDVGSQYRSVIFYTTDEQQRIARAYIEQLDGAPTFRRPIVTQVVPLKGFYPAESYHQDYAFRHPNDLYIVVNDRPKVENLQRRFPALYRASRVP
jgi:peptide-methionine (S)-S-oxide reductase